MPVEIKELHIKAIVTDTMRDNSKPVKIDLDKLKKDLLKQCVEEVLQKIKEKNER